MKQAAIIIFTILLLSSCQERVTYKWGDINESLGELQSARNELQDEISNLESEGYDCSQLEEIDARLKKVESILDEHFQ